MIEGPHPDMNSVEQTDSLVFPEYYTSIEPVSNSAMMKAEIPLLEGELRDDKSVLYEELQMESQWLADTAAACSAAYHPTTKDSGISWAAFHANRQEGIPETMKTAILPLFTESSNSPAMIKHAMSITNAVVKHLNPGQIPVITLDQPLYVIAKTVQWAFPRDSRRGQVCAADGGLHIEKAAFTLPGDLLEGSGWVEVLTEAGIFTSGVADSCLTAIHIKRTRYAHEVTAVVLYAIMMKQYTEYRVSVVPDDTPDDIDTWTVKMSAQFQYMRHVLQLELLILVYTRSIREAKFGLYKSNLTGLAPWFMMLNHTHYARWLPVHIRDMVTLSELHPQTAAEFENGHFTVNKTGRLFSNMAAVLEHGS